MATSAQYTTTAKIGAAAMTTGDASRTAPTTVSTVFTAGASGSRIDKLTFIATGTTTATMARWWMYTGATYFLIAEVPIAAVTPSNTIPTFTVNLNSVINYNILPLIIPSGYSIRATVNDTTSGGINAIAYGGDF
jgi:hypothetical protein